MTIRHDPRVRRGEILARATLSPAGLVSGAALAGLGLAVGIGWPFVAGAALAAWGTSAWLHLRDPKLASRLLEPQFERDLGVLDRDHRPLMTAALVARDRFEQSVAEVPDSGDFAGMRARVTEAVNRLYDSVVWAQRADRFLLSVDQDGLRQRLSSLPPGSSVAEELQEQLEEVNAVAARRSETLAKVHATTTGIETLAVKTASWALGSTAPGTVVTPLEDVRRLRQELDGYVEGLAEVEAELRRTLPGTA